MCKGSEFFCHALHIPSNHMNYLLLFGVLLVVEFLRVCKYFRVVKEKDTLDTIS